MDLLRNAVVDITTLTATYRALTHGSLAGKLGVRRKLRNRLRTELKQGVEAYVDALARSKRGVLDSGQLASCRLAAERQMPRALHHQWELSQVMKTVPGSLFGLAAARQDLWRLAHMAIYLRQGIAAMRDSGDDLDQGAVKKAGSLLRRKFTRGLVAYARASQRISESEDHMIVAARKAALRAIGRRGTAAAESLGQFEADVGAAQTVIQRGVVKPLADLVLDWA